MTKESVKKTFRFILIASSALLLVLLYSRRDEQPRSIQADDGVGSQPRPTEKIAPLVESRSARTPSEPSEPEQPVVSSLPSVQGKIRGQVIDRLGRPVSPAMVELHQGNDLQELQEVNEKGEFSFAVSPGDYTVRVAEEGLPANHLPPWNQTQVGSVYTDDPNFPSGFYATKVSVPRTGGEFAIELRVFLAATAAGYVIGPQGEPVEGAFVRLQSCIAPTGLQATEKTDVTGRFEMSRVYPGRYFTQIILKEAVDPAHRQMAVPLPEKVTVEEGGIYELSRLQVGVGSKRITGVVLNQDGRPFVGVLVACYPPLEGWGAEVLRTETDVDGRFLLDGLPSASFKVRVGDFEPNRIGKCKAAFWIQPLEVDLRTDDSVNLPPIQLDESRPFTFEGKVELDSGWSIRDLRVEVDLVSPEEFVDPKAPRRPSFSKQQLKLDKESGKFTWMCETPHAPVKITIRSKKMDIPVEVVVYPEPDERLQKEFSIPK